MRTRRSFLGSVAAAAALPLGMAGRRAFAQSAGRPRLHAMIVGMNVYTGHVGLDDPRAHRCVPHPVPQLRGCINDARDIEAAVRPLAASTRILLDREVNRASFVRAWNGMVADAAPGDTLLLTYSGHGGQEPEHVKGSEQTGLDDTLILSPFDSCVPGLDEERIIDDEIAGLLASVRGRNKVIFVADACHSGTMTRSAVDARVDDTITYRTVHKYDYAATLPSAVTIASIPGNDDQPHVLYLSACQDNELVPELRINGRHHGALSVAFAQALAGRADTNQDGVITGAELNTYVLRTVRAFSDSNQHPEVRWPHADVVYGDAFKREDPVFFLGASSVPETPSVAAGSNALVRLRILGIDTAAAAAIARSLKRASIVGSDDPADVVWDSEQRRVLNQLGSMFASDVAAADLQPVIDGVIALNAVRQMVANSGVDMRLLLPDESIAEAPSRASDRVHPERTRLTLVATGLRYPYFVLFNIAGNGTVQMLYPCHGQAGSCKAQRDAPTVPAGKAYSLQLEAARPFGADHVIAVSAARPPSDLIAALEGADGQKDPITAVEALTRLAKTSDVLIGMQGVFTTGK